MSKDEIKKFDDLLTQVKKLCPYSAELRKKYKAINDVLINLDNPNKDQLTRLTERLPIDLIDPGMHKGDSFLIPRDHNSDL